MTTSRSVCIGGQGFQLNGFQFGSTSRLTLKKDYMRILLGGEKLRKQFSTLSVTCLIDAITVTES